MRKNPAQAQAQNKESPTQEPNFLSFSSQRKPYLCLLGSQKLSPHHADTQFTKLSEDVYQKLHAFVIPFTSGLRIRSRGRKGVPKKGRHRSGVELNAFRFNVPCGCVPRIWKGGLARLVVRGIRQCVGSCLAFASHPSVHRTHNKEVYTARPTLFQRHELLGCFGYSLFLGFGDPLAVHDWTGDHS